MNGLLKGVQPYSTQARKWLYEPLQTSLAWFEEAHKDSFYPFSTKLSFCLVYK
jgi:hypothetical protein